MKLKLLFLPFILLSVFVHAQPAGYYSSVSGLSGAPLKTALYNIIKGHTAVSYDGLWTAFETTDKKPNGKVWDMYSNCTFTFGSNQCATIPASVIALIANIHGQKAGLMMLLLCILTCST